LRASRRKQRIPSADSSLPAAALRHQISETPRALFSSDEVKLNVHAGDVQPHGVERVALELLDRFFKRRCLLHVSAHHQISGYQSSSPKRVATQHRQVEPQSALMGTTAKDASAAHHDAAFATNGGRPVPKWVVPTGLPLTC